MKMKLVPLLLFISLQTFGQFTGAGGGVKPSQNTRSGNVYTAFIVGISSPTGVFKANDLTKDFSQAIGVKPGLVFGMHGYSDFKLDLGTPKLKAGLNFTTALTLHQVNWEKWVANSQNFKKFPFMIVDFRLGPSLGYRFSDKIAGDVFFNLGPAMGLGGSGEWSNGTTITSFSSTSVPFGLKTGFGVTLRLSDFLIGLQYTPVKLKFKYDLETGTSSSSPVITKEYQLQMNTLQFFIGFGKKR